MNANEMPMFAARDSMNVSTALFRAIDRPERGERDTTDLAFGTIGSNRPKPAIHTSVLSDHTQPYAFADPLFCKEYQSMNREVKSTARPRHRRWVPIGFVIAGIASIFGFAAMVFTAVTRVQSGRGMETYHTFWLVEDSWIGFLTFVACAGVALIFGAVLQFRDHLRWRKFEKRFKDQSGNG